MKPLMVPSSLKWFEALALVGFAIRTWLYLEYVRAHGTLEAYDVIGVIIGFVIAAGLVFLTSRRRKRWAKWMLIFVIVSTAMAFAGNLERAVRADAFTFTI